MNKLLVVAALVALLALSAESFRVPRQVEEEEPGTLTKVTDCIKTYYNNAVNTISDYLEGIRGLKVEEKAMNFYSDTTTIISTYFSIAQDQMYHFFYQK